GRPRRLRPPGQESGRAAGREWKSLGRGRRSAQPLPGAPRHVSFCLMHSRLLHLQGCLHLATGALIGIPEKQSRFCI
ncbi:unnamed protein product, partial [Gulo gulo]